MATRHDEEVQAAEAGQEPTSAPVAAPRSVATGAPPRDVPPAEVTDEQALIEEARRRQRRRQRRVGTLLVAVLAVIAGLVAYQSSGSPPATTGSGSSGEAAGTTWRSAGTAVWQHGLPGNYLGFGPSTTITCVGAASSACYVIIQANGVQPDGAPTTPGVAPALAALRSSAYRSDDGGSSWTTLPLPGDAWLSSRLACSGPSTCAVGAIIGASPGSTPGHSGRAVVLTTSDGGRTWSAHKVPGAVGLVTDLACPSAAHCVALAWGRSVPTIAGLQPYSGANRFFPTSVLTTEDGGRTWSTSTLPKTPSGVYDDLSSVTCPTSAQCIVLGERADIVEHDGGYVEANEALLVLSSHDGGHSLTTSYRGPSLWPDGVACANGSSCLALAQRAPSPPVVLSTSDGGRTWTTVSSSGPSADFAPTAGSLACPSPGHCLSAAGVGVATTSDGGRRWSTTSSFPNLPVGYASNDVDEISCLGSGVCLALDDMGHPASSATGAMGTRVLTNAAQR